MMTTNDPKSRLAEIGKALEERDVLLRRLVRPPIIKY